MKLQLWFFEAPLVLVAVLFQFMPLITRRGIFFSATVDPDFPASNDGRRSLRSFRLQAGLWALAAWILAALLASERPQYSALLPMLLIIGGTGFSYWLKFREVHTRYGRREPEIREANLTVAKQKLKLRGWIVLPPFVALAATAVYLGAHWTDLPLKFPVHWDMHAQPNRWATRDFTGVFGPLIVATAMNLSFLFFAWGLTRITRKGIMQYITIRMLEVLLYPLTFTFVTVALLPMVQMPVWLTPAVMLVFVAVIFWWSYRKLTAASSRRETPEPQSDSYWKAGVFYFNPSDPAIFVSKRVGIGYTMNFANKISWLVLLGILLIAVLPALLVKMK